MSNRCFAAWMFSIAFILLVALFRPEPVDERFNDLHIKDWHVDAASVVRITPCGMYIANFRSGYNPLIVETNTRIVFPEICDQAVYMSVNPTTWGDVMNWRSDADSRAMVWFRENVPGLPETH